MKKILSAGKSFEQGWNGQLASLDEKPGMQSSFTYDYWIDSTEVTQKQYYDVTGKRPVLAGSQYGAGDNYPVYYVSWFDAVLYCNARSRAERLDTVYTYSAAEALEKGTVYTLAGLRCDVTRDGYRLPTEAEWEFAARGASSSLSFSTVSDSSYACYYAWFGKNSLDRSHLVATRLPNSLGLYDMAGNVFEWTNDWKCMYDGKSITNSLGALKPGNEYEKVIKGGSYNYLLMYLRPSHRSATYATELSTACEYVGFRCARGSIPNGQYIGIGQQVVTSNQVDILTSIHGLRAKIVFVNVTRGYNRTLCYIDFSKTYPYVLEYLDDKNVFLPTISPDGRYVAYCSNDEGQSGPSKITIRSLDSLGTPRVVLAPDTAYAPRWWVNQTGDTCIVYTNSACDNENLSWSSTKTFSQKVSGGTPVGTPTTLISDGSYHGGVSLDGHNAVTGYTRLMMKDLLASSTGQQLFLSPHNGKDGKGSTQVCNVSISPDTGSSVRCLFLDFGYQGKTSTITNCGYGQHEYLFVSTMSDSIVNYMHCPAGEQSWDNPKWSNQPELAVGCGRNSSGQSHAIYVIDLDKKNYQQIISGVELQQPYLWTQENMNPFVFSLDSLGHYNDPPLGEGGLSCKMHLFWLMHDSLEIAFMGSSQALQGFNCSIIKELSSINMAAPGLGISGMDMLIRDYFIYHCPKIRMIFMGVTPYWLADSGGNAYNLWTIGWTQNKGYLYDQSHQFWVNGLPPGYEKAAVNAPYGSSQGLDTFGFLPIGCMGWGPDTPACGGRVDWDTNDAIYKTNYAIIKSLVQDLSVLKIHLIVVIFPENPGFKYTGNFAMLGPSWPTGIAVMQQFKSLEDGNPYYHFYDAYNKGNNDYVYSDFYNSNHLCVDGATKLTSRLDTLIDSILAK